MKIKEWIQQPESKVLEFKRDLSSLTPILKTVVAFANTSGGTLIIGRDASGTLIGVPDVLLAEERLANAIADTIHPAIFPEIEVATVRHADLLIVRVCHWKGPFYLKSAGMPKGVYVRLGSTSRPAGPDLVAEMQRVALNTSFDQQPLTELDATVLDQTKLENGLQRSVGLKQLQTLGLVAPQADRLVPTVGGLLLLGREPQRALHLPDARISCARFRSASKAGIIDRMEFAGPLVEALQQILAFLERNCRLGARIEGMVREDIQEYHLVALREALVNALVHADYSVVGAHVQVALFSDRLEIQNPGMLPFGFTMDDLMAGVSRVRNRVIARVFRELGLMEEWGSGYQRMMEACDAGGYPRPEWTELGNAIRVVFAPHQHTSPVVASPQEDLAGRDAEILSLFEDGSVLSFKEIIGRLQKPPSSRMLRYNLARLREQGLLTRSGKGPGTKWMRS